MQRDRSVRTSTHGRNTTKPANNINPCGINTVNIQRYITTLPAERSLNTRATRYVKGVNGTAQIWAHATYQSVDTWCGRWGIRKIATAL